MSTARSRFWTWYAIAWLPYVATVLLAYAWSGERQAVLAFQGAGASALPLALLGVAVVRINRGLRWAPESPGRSLAVQAGLALLYALVVVTAQDVLFVLSDWARRGELRLAFVAPAIMLWQFLFAVIVYCALAGITHTIGTQARLRAEEERSARARALQVEAELGALRAQLNPHFLFNTLHTLLALVREDPPRAEKALEQLGDLLRYALRVQQEPRDEAALAEEWKFVADYLALEQLRLGARLRVEADLSPGALACIVPVFCLQPLVENAIRHGIAPRAGGGTLAIQARLDDGRVDLAVADDGRGASEDVLGASTGSGLKLVRQRIEALYPGRGEMTVEPRPPGGGFVVRLRLPARLPS
jgi:sensor histidine kinase YesM